MSINGRHAINQKVARRYGKLWGSVDFECNQNVSADAFHDNPDRPTVGQFMIGGKRFDVTMEELNYIQQTAKDAQDVVMKRYRLGRMGKLSRR